MARPKKVINDSDVTIKKEEPILTHEEQVIFLLKRILEEIMRR